MNDHTSGEPRDLSGRVAVLEQSPATPRPHSSAIEAKIDRRFWPRRSWSGTTRSRPAPPRMPSSTWPSSRRQRRAASGGSRRPRERAVGADGSAVKNDHTPPSTLPLPGEFRMASKSTSPDAAPDDLDLATVARRLGKTPPWLKWRLSADRGEPEPELQHHHYFGRTPQWTESEYQQLRQALITRTRQKAGASGNVHKPDAASGLFVIARDGNWYISGRVRPKEIASAFERVQAWPLSPARAKTPKNSAAKKKPNRRRTHLRDPSFGSVRGRRRKIPEPPPERALNPIDIARLKELNSRFPRSSA